MALPYRSSSLADVGCCNIRCISSQTNEIGIRAVPRSGRMSNAALHGRAERGAPARTEPFPTRSQVSNASLRILPRAGLVQWGILALHQRRGKEGHQDQHNGRRSSVQKDEVGERPFVIDQVRANNIGPKESHIPNREDQRVAKTFAPFRRCSRREIDQSDFRKPKKKPILRFDQHRPIPARIEEKKQRSGGRRQRLRSISLCEY